MKFAVVLYFVCTAHLICSSLQAQPKDIPSEIYVFGMKLNLSSDLRKELQKQVTEITKSKSFYQAKVNRATMYFPIIERVFEEEELPQDFKYLAIQESSLQSDAVSPSQAVGYWQFKKESALEVGIKINSEVDERKHIVESSRAAARYIRKNYLLLTNWVYALIAYNTGYSGAQPFVQTRYMGAQEMDVDTKLHWYAIKFLAIKLAYEDQAGYGSPDYYLLEYNTDTQGKSLRDIAKKADLPEERLIEYNKWLQARTIPNDKNYTVIIPTTYMEKDQIMKKLQITTPQPATPTIQPNLANNTSSAPSSTNTVALITYFNGIKAIKARSNDNAATLAYAGEISIQKLKKYNDMEPFEEIVPGKIYYLKPKRFKGTVLYHTVEQDESLWEISQKYGIKLKQLIRKNRIEKLEKIVPGRKLYLRSKRPKNEPVLVLPIPPKTSIDEIKSEDISHIPNTPTPVATTLTSAVMNSPRKNETSVSANQPAYISGNTSRMSTIKIDSSYRWHAVQPGQTMFAISRHYKIPIDSLKSWNNIGPEGIKYGQILVVAKENNSLQKKFNIFLMPTDFTLRQLADSLQIDVHTLQKWNSKSTEVVLPGEYLKIEK